MKHETLYDFANSCQYCGEPMTSTWNWYRIGYSIPFIDHKDTCKKAIQDRIVGQKIFENSLKLGLL